MLKISFWGFVRAIFLVSFVDFLWAEASNDKKTFRWWTVNTALCCWHFCFRCDWPPVRVLWSVSKVLAYSGRSSCHAAVRWLKLLGRQSTGVSTSTTTSSRTASRSIVSEPMHALTGLRMRTTCATEPRWAVCDWLRQFLMNSVFEVVRTVVMFWMWVSRFV